MSLRHNSIKSVFESFLRAYYLYGINTHSLITCYDQTQRFYAHTYLLAISFGFTLSIFPCNEHEQMLPVTLSHLYILATVLLLSEGVWQLFSHQLITSKWKHTHFLYSIEKEEKNDCRHQHLTNEIKKEFCDFIEKLWYYNIQRQSRAIHCSSANEIHGNTIILSK